MKPLDEWDATYLDELVPREETTNFEKKASEGCNSATIAKGVCALANSGGGFIAFGFKDEKAGNGLDAGVPSMNGRQPVKDWAEALIPKLHQPPIAGCEARFIQHGSHAADRGVLVIAVPLSERRPHWVKDTEKPYLRTGAHSPPMPMQIFADMLTRGNVPRVDVAELGLDFRGDNRWTPYHSGTSFPLNPKIILESGPICETWACEIEESTGFGEFKFAGIATVPPVDYTNGRHACYKIGEEPLFPGRKTSMLGKGGGFRFCLPLHYPHNIEIVIRLYAASAPPVEKRYSYCMSAARLCLPRDEEVV